MLSTILNLKGAQQISKKEQRSINGVELLCKSNGMCAEYGSHCLELACQEVPSFEIEFYE